MPTNHHTMPELKTIHVKRFWEKVAIRPSGCWEWTACVSHNGYGRITIDYTTYPSHRVAYYLYNNIDPLEKLVLHKCDNPPCVNPFHLWIGTTQDNARDRCAKGRNADIRGSKNPVSILTADDVLQIRHLYKNGNTQREIAKQFNIHFGNIWCIVNRKSWKHI